MIKLKEKMTFELFSSIWSYLSSKIQTEYYEDPYPGLRIAEVEFLEPYIEIVEIDSIVFSVMRLLLKYAYPIKSSYGKFTIGIHMIVPDGGEVSFTLGAAITFRVDGRDCPVYYLVEDKIREFAEEYGKGYEITKINLRLYHDGVTDNNPILNLEDDELGRLLWNCISCQEVVEPKEVQRIGPRKSSYPNILTALKPTRSQRKAFIVADIETLLVDQVHFPYAVGFLVVNPGDSLSSKRIETYFSEEYSHLQCFEDRSQKMLYYFIERLASVVRRNRSLRTVYFHNFSRFDGIFLLKHLATYHSDKYKIESIIRNNKIYEIAVYHGKTLIFYLRDSFTLLTSGLDKLAKSLCPELGSKGSIPHADVEVSKLRGMKDELLEYMKQDIRLLGGVMLKAQDIYWSEFNVDIVSELTVSSLALTIFRMKYYDPKNLPIHIPNGNADSFIRRAYYGGHADAYIPFGENLYYYDVNSLYPYIMKSFPMPCGEPVWHGHLENEDIDNLFGFIEAYVVCPSTISRPFLPYRTGEKSIIFPTGRFVGVYYSEELKYAKQIGYKIYPFRGYLFENNNSSPFVGYVDTLFSKRQEAKTIGNDAMSYIYKLLLNSLYGRFGINPKSSVTEVCNYDRYNYILKYKEFIRGEKLSNEKFIVIYSENTVKTSDLDWKPPRISAVQLAAAVTACARIHMYPYISRSDSYYTDTDSVVLGSPLPEEEISSTELGKFKLEYKIRKGFFLAPKSYSLYCEGGDNILKHKGLAKHLVDEEWFESQYSDMSRTTETSVESNFRIDWLRLNIVNKEIRAKLGMRINNRRKFIYKNQKWVDTEPLEVTDLAGQDSRVLTCEVQTLLEYLADKESLIADKDSQIADKESKIAHQANEIAQLKDETANLSSEKAKQASLIANQASELALLKDEMANLSCEKAKQASLIANQASELAQLKDEMAKQASELAQLKNELARLIKIIKKSLQNKDNENNQIDDKDNKPIDDKAREDSTLKEDYLQPPKGKKPG